MDLHAVAGKRVILKPNFNSADEPPGSTHNDTLTNLILQLKEAKRQPWGITRIRQHFRLGY